MVQQQIDQADLLILGDIGGTNCRLSLWKGSECCFTEYYLAEEYDLFEHIVDAFMDLCTARLALMQESEKLVKIDSNSAPSIRHACLAVAGRVDRGRVYLTNLNWQLSEDDLSERIGCQTYLVNDVYAQALAVSKSSANDRIHLSGPTDIDPKKTMVVLGVGTGLGEALLIPCNQKDEPYYHAVATEGGHARFAPRNESEIGLMRWLVGLYGSHISVERVVSGQGLVNIYRYLLGGRALPDLFDNRLNGEMISYAALELNDELCMRALEIFVSVLADEAANLVLKCDAATVCLSGGIPPKIIPAFHAYFSSAFLDKGRFRNTLAQVGVWIMNDPKLGLKGAYLTVEERCQATL